MNQLSTIAAVVGPLAFVASFGLFVAGAATGRKPLTALGLTAVVATCALLGAGMRIDMNVDKAYQAQVQHTLRTDYDATVSAGSVTYLPTSNKSRSSQDVVLTANGTAHTCLLETGTSSADVSVVCNGTALPKR